MNPTLHHTYSIKVSPSPLATSDTVCRFNLEITYREKGIPQIYLGVFVPASLRELLLSAENNIDAIHLETLESNSIAARELAKFCEYTQPGYLILGVRMRDGQEYQEVPNTLVFARRIRTVFSYVGIVVSGLLLSCSFPLTGAITYMAASHILKATLRIPAHPFHVFQLRK